MPSEATAAPMQECPTCHASVEVGIPWCPTCGTDLRDVLILPERPSDPPLPAAPNKGGLRPVLLIAGTALAGLLFACIACVVISNLTAPDEPETVAGLGIVSPTPDVTTESTDPPESPLSPTAAPEARVPGLTPDDVERTLADQGLACAAAEFDGVYYHRTCLYEESLLKFQVVIYGRHPETVDLVEGTVFQYTAAPSDAAALPHLALIAALPHTGAFPEQARAWVEQTLPSLGEAGAQDADFSDVPYELWGPAGARVLTIGALPVEDDPTLAPLLASTAVPSDTPTPTATSSPAPTLTSPPTSTPQPTATDRPTRTPTTPPSCICSSNTYNCDDFPLADGTGADQCYQYCLAAGAGDIHDLDRDNDNDACEPGWGD